MSRPFTSIYIDMRLMRMRRADFGQHKTTAADQSRFTRAQMRQRQHFPRFGEFGRLDFSAGDKDDFDPGLDLLWRSRAYRQPPNAGCRRFEVKPGRALSCKS
jgi:hypothetical protein